MKSEHLESTIGAEMKKGKNGIWKRCSVSRVAAFDKLEDGVRASLRDADDLSNLLTP
jgi:hypothetical protein